jgi:GNAT superfamily N-acetyltransferase
MDDWKIQPLDRTHRRSEFSCGNSSLDEFVRALVTQYEKRKLGRTYVAALPNDKRVYGYYTLAAGSVGVQNLPPKAAKKLPKHPVPVILLGRLAVDQAAQGRGLGARLLMDPLKRCLELSASLGIHAVVVTAIDEAAKNFYGKYGFAPLMDDGRHLYLPLTSVEKMAAQVDRGPAG